MGCSMRRRRRCCASPWIRSSSRCGTEIAAASTEQSKGIGQINEAVNQVNNVTQQNAAHSEESASAAEELVAQAGQLAQMVGAFKVNGGVAVPAQAQHMAQATGGPVLVTAHATPANGGAPAAVIPLTEQEMRRF